MENYDLLFIILCVLFIVILTIGICLKLYTKRRLRDIDAFQGIVRKKDCTGKPIAIQIDFINNKQISRREISK